MLLDMWPLQGIHKKPFLFSYIAIAGSGDPMKEYYFSHR